MTEQSNDVRLVILMRDDIPYLNAGKACAQATHAANQCVGKIRYCNVGGPRWMQQNEWLAEWEKQTPDKFGTVIVLSANQMEISMAVCSALAATNLAYGVVHDPTYPTGTPDKSYWGTFFIGMGLSVSLLMLDASILAMLVALATTVYTWVGDFFRKAVQSILPPTIPLNTCAYLFGPSAEIAKITKELKLKLMA